MNAERRVDSIKPPFLYTLDQIAQILNLTIERLEKVYVVKIRPGGNTSRKDLVGGRRMVARNISPDSNPDWRISDAEFNRWMKLMGFLPMSMREYF